MLITNNYNLPQALIDCVNENHEIVEKHYSVTTILNPVREIILKRRHKDEIEQDISDMVWMILGTAVHKIIEEADKTGKAEMHLEQPIIDNYVLTGITDLYDENEFTVIDWKTASAWKIIHKEFDDWKKQGLMYAWLLRRSGFYVAKLKFNALLKDWSKRDKLRYGSDYPEHPIYVWEYEIQEQDIIDIESFIINKFKEIIEAEKLSDDDLPICSKEDRWNDGDKYAVMKSGRKLAIKICDSKEEASSYITGSDMYIEVRPGEDKKCEDYCLCKKFCKYWREKHGTRD